MTSVAVFFVDEFFSLTFRTRGALQRQVSQRVSWEDQRVCGVLCVLLYFVSLTPSLFFYTLLYHSFAHFFFSFFPPPSREPEVHHSPIPRDEITDLLDVAEKRRHESILVKSKDRHQNERKFLIEKNYGYEGDKESRGRRRGKRRTEENRRRGETQYLLVTWTSFFCFFQAEPQYFYFSSCVTSFGWKCLHLSLPFTYVAYYN